MSRRAGKLGASLRKALVRALPSWAQASLLLRRMHGDTSVADDVVVKLADEPELFLQAARLTFEAYAAKRLVDHRGVPLRVTPYLLVPSTLTLVALRRGEVIGTVSLIQDSELGLPMASVFSSEVDALRRVGRRVAEVGALAIKKGERGGGLATLLHKAAFELAKRQGVQDVVIAVHPDAQPIYALSMMFEPLTNEVRSYPGLNSVAAAVGLRLNIETFSERVRQAYPKVRPGQFNPRVYFETEHSQLRLQATSAERERVHAAHTQAAFRMASLRPDMLVELKDSAFESLRQALTGEARLDFVQLPISG